MCQIRNADELEDEVSIATSPGDVSRSGHVAEAAAHSHQNRASGWDWTWRILAAAAAGGASWAILAAD